MALICSLKLSCFTLPESTALADGGFLLVYCFVVLLVIFPNQFMRYKVIFFKKIIYYPVCVHGVCVGGSGCGGPRTALWGWFSPFDPYVGSGTPSQVAMFV